MASALDRVMGQADEAAQNFRQTDDSNLPATRQQQGTAVATTRPSLDSMMDSSGITVDGFLTLKYEGFRFGDYKGLFDEFVATLSIPEVVPIFQVRSTIGGNTNFLKSYDGVMTPSGQSFEAAIRQEVAKGANITGPYQTSEIPLTLVEDVNIPGKDGGTIKAGTRIGTTPPLTGTGLFGAFLKEMREKGLLGSTVKVKVVHVPKTNRNNNEWGLADFVFLEEVDEQP